MATGVLAADVWAQCDREECQKWRRLPPGTVIDEESKWFCEMNPDPTRNSCSLPEEAYDKDNEKVIEQPLPKVVPVPIVYPMPAPAAPAPSRGRGRPRGRSKSASAGRPPKRHSSDGRTQWQGGSSRSTPGRLSHSSSAPRQPQATARQQHDALCKLMARAGMWEVIQGQGRMAVLPPDWLWGYLAAHAPDVAAAACKAVDLHTAADYFKGTSQQGAVQAEDMAAFARLAVTTAAAAASLSTGKLLAAEAQHAQQAQQETQRQAHMVKQEAQPQPSLQMAHPQQPYWAAQPQTQLGAQQPLHLQGQQQLLPPQQQQFHAPPAQHVGLQPQQQQAQQLPLLPPMHSVQTQQVHRDPQQHGYPQQQPYQAQQWQQQLAPRYNAPPPPPPPQQQAQW